MNTKVKELLLKANLKNIANELENRVTANYNTHNERPKKIIDFRGIPLGIEWKKGEVRNYGPTDNFRKEMQCDYGFIFNTIDNDGGGVDCYVGPDNTAPYVYILTQLRPHTGEYDEDKVMLGFPNAASAVRMYLDHMPEYMFGGIIRLPFKRFQYDYLPNKRKLKFQNNKRKIQTNF